jgi:molecular chaperone GrpE (heat shock protein)
LEDWTRSEKKTNEMAWILNRIQHILEDAGIEQIKVEPGDSFNRRFHARNDGATEPGTISSVIRQGYIIKDKQSGEDITLRLAEVTVKKTPEGNSKS